MAVITLFDSSRVSADQRPARANEDSYEYLGMSGRPVIAAVRSCLEDWFVHYPNDAKGMLAGRFRGSQLIPALFELYVFSLLRKQGYHPVVIEESPQQASERMPDFRIDLADGSRLFVEATTVDCDPGMSKLDLDLAPFKVVLDQLRAPHRFSVKVATDAPSPLAYAKCRNRIDEWFCSQAFHARQSEALRDGADSVDKKISCGEWVIEVTAYVSGPFAEPPPAGESPIVLWGTGVHFLDHVERLRKSLKRKADHYAVDGPVVVAVSPLGSGIDRDAIEAAVYGPTLHSEDIHRNVSIVRTDEGFWFKPNRSHKNAGFPGVLVCPDIHPTTVLCSTPTFYRAPQAGPEWSQFLPKVSHGNLIDPAVSYTAGLQGFQLLGMPREWLKE